MASLASNPETKQKTEQLTTKERLAQVRDDGGGGTLRAPILLSKDTSLFVLILFVSRFDLQRLKTIPTHCFVQCFDVSPFCFDVSPYCFDAGR